MTTYVVEWSVYVRGTTKVQATSEDAARAGFYEIDGDEVLKQAVTEQKDGNAGWNEFHVTHVQEDK